MASLLSNAKLGNTSASGLVKSATTLQNQLADYQDKLNKANFDNNPTSDNLNAYISYLQGRIGNLTSTGTIADASKALTLTNEVNSAIKASTTFNIDMITGQMLAGGATDQTKLDYLTNNVLANPLVQQSPDMYVKYQNEAYNLQKSIQYQAQQQSLAAEVQYNSDLAAQERGFSNAEAGLKANWTQLQDAVKNGNQALVQKAFKDSMAILAPVYKSAGLPVPKNATGDIATAHVGLLLGLASFYEHAAIAAGPDNPDYQSYVQKAQGVLQGGELRTALSNALAPSNLFSPSTNAQGQTTESMNAITGYHTVTVQVPGLQPVTLNVPTTSGNSQTPFQALGSKQGALENKLKALGFNITSGKGSSQLEVAVSDKALKWLGNQPDLAPGSKLTVIPTARGLEFISANNTHYGLSFDQKGLAGLFTQGGTGVWKLVGGQYGFNPKQQSTIATATNKAQGLVNAFKSAISFGTTPPAKGPSMVQRAGGGFNFLNAQGQAISAATYAKLTGTQFRTLLQSMANRGDTGAKTALNFVGNDFGYNPNMIGGNASTYNALVWGAHSLAPQGAAPTNYSIKGL